MPLTWPAPVAAAAGRDERRDDVTTAATDFGNDEVLLGTRLLPSYHFGVPGNRALPQPCRKADGDTIRVWGNTGGLGTREERYPGSLVNGLYTLPCAAQLVPG